MNQSNPKESSGNRGSWLKAIPWKRICLTCLCVFLSLTLITLIFVTAYAEKILGQLGRIEDDSLGDATSYTDPIIDPTIEPIDPDYTTPVPTPDQIIAHKDIINIMLVGQDRRPGTSGRTLSDVMILCTINKKADTITLTSFMRDLYVQIPGRGGSKMNAAYMYGGTDLLGKTLLENFGVQVDSYLEVDFNGFKNIVNILGGVDITLTAAEAEYMNTTDWDGLDHDGWALKAGVNHLNGDQALAYSRIRHIGSDYARTERQRRVLNAILEGCKSKSLPQIISLVDDILPLIATDMTNKEIINYCVELFPLLSGCEVSNQRIPVDGSYYDDGSCIYPNLILNRQFLVDTLLPK